MTVAVVVLVNVSDWVETTPVVAVLVTVAVFVTVTDVAIVEVTVAMEILRTLEQYLDAPGAIFKAATTRLTALQSTTRSPSSAGAAAANVARNRPLRSMVLIED